VTADAKVELQAFFKFFDVARKDLSARATLRYGISSELIAVLERSQRWGRIKAEVFCAMKSKYAMALYEMLELRRNMDRCVETFSIERFREMRGVKTDTYKLGPDFQRFVIDPAVLEVNGLSDLGVRMQLDRKHSRAPIHAVTMAWWRKSPEEMTAAIRERNRSKVGRMARLKGAVETAAPRLESAGVTEVIASTVR
jgi:plasmid replication initiation protein